eukprot:12937684-Prorocentrum_lima.AAC.1
MALLQTGKVLKTSNLDGKCFALVADGNKPTSSPSTPTHLRCVSAWEGLGVELLHPLTESTYALFSLPQDLNGIHHLLEE